MSKLNLSLQDINNLSGLYIEPISQSNYSTSKINGSYGMQTGIFSFFITKPGIYSVVVSPEMIDSDSKKTTPPLTDNSTSDIDDSTPNIIENTDEHTNISTESDDLIEDIDTVDGTNEDVNGEIDELIVDETYDNDYDKEDLYDIPYKNIDEVIVEDNIRESSLLNSNSILVTLLVVIISSLTIFLIFLIYSKGQSQ